MERRVTRGQQDLYFALRAEQDAHEQAELARRADAAREVVLMAEQERSRQRAEVEAAEAAAVAAAHGATTRDHRTGEARLGLGRSVALYCTSSAPYQTR